MRAVVILNERHVIAEDAFVEMVVWQVPQTQRRSSHRLKYRLAFVVSGECVLRYDNEAGKGDHRHLGAREAAYGFVSHERLLADFWNDVDTRMKRE